ncbi:hypothetical protein SDC9_169901 [bioreactor metagenome]|uniref:Uncharacterized protein n=1 Tax=bioreactor metagenome TaxID=1076179 RepID=A0A645G6L6_9ZZZZ
MPAAGCPLAGDQAGPHVQGGRPETRQVLPEEMPEVQGRRRRFPRLPLRLDQAEAGRTGQSGRRAGRGEEEFRQRDADRQLRTSCEQPAQTLLERRFRRQLVCALPRRTESPSAEGATEDVLIVEAASETALGAQPPLPSASAERNPSGGIHRAGRGGDSAVAEARDAAAGFPLLHGSLRRPGAADRVAHLFPDGNGHGGERPDPTVETRTGNLRGRRGRLRSAEGTGTADGGDGADRLGRVGFRGGDRHDETG